jgi:hypothetical protein
MLMLDLLDSADTAVLLVAAIILTVAVGWSAGHSVTVMARWPKVPALVVRYWIVRSEGKADGQRFYRAVFRFTTTDGRRVTTISTLGVWRRPWRVGTIVPVRYHPDNPRWVKAACFSEMWGIPSTCFALLVMVLALLATHTDLLRG